MDRRTDYGVSAGGRVIAEAFVSEADARLIAAAPDLLAVAERAAFCLPEAAYPGLLADIRAALTKAGTARQNGTNPGRHTVPSIQTEEVKL